jgi:hypothetical protein
MSKLTLRTALVTLFLFSWLLGACGSSLPGDINVDILELRAKEISLTELQAAFAGNNLTPPLYAQSAGTTLYGIVIPFDISRLPDGINYNIVRVSVIILKDVGESGFPENEDVNVVTAIPLNVERTTDKTASSKFAASITGTIKALSGNLSAEQSSSETYEKLYRSVTAHITPHNEIYWEFTPFLDEPIQPGLYYVIAVVEVPIGTTGNLFYVSAGCSYSASSVFGTSGETGACMLGETQKFYIP